MKTVNKLSQIFMLKYFSCLFIVKNFPIRAISPKDRKGMDREFLLKFIYSEKARKFCEIPTLLLSVCTIDKSKVEILQNFVSFSEYTNFIRSYEYNFALFCLPHLVHVNFEHFEF